MVAAVFLVILLVVAATVGLLAFLRRVVKDEAAAEGRMLASDAHVVEYSIPAGIDAADLRGAIAVEGFTGVVIEGPTSERLRVVCAEPDRTRLRTALEHAHSAASGDAPLDLSPVVFDDERPHEV